MQIVSLITSPESAHLRDGPVDALRRRWRGGATTWLAPGIAAEFATAAMPADFPLEWRHLQDLGIDLTIQPEQGRRKAILIADMDSTMIQQECVDELADLAGVGARVADITARAMNGALDFDAALTERVALLAGLDETVIAQTLRERITLAPGAKPLVATMRANGAYTALVSGGFTAFSQPIARDLGFDENRANRLLAESGRLTGKVAAPILGREAKVEALRQIAARLGLTPHDALAVGDGANDLGMIGLAGTGVALHAKPVVAAQAKIRINHGDLTALLYLQGYAKDQFQT